MATAVNGQAVLVVGSTGSQGGAVARALLQQGLRVRALTRKPESAAAARLRESGAELVQGDLDSVEDLRRAMEGVHGVYGVTDFFRHGVAKEVEHGKRLVDVARERRVEHFVFASVANSAEATGVPHFASKWKIEQHLQASGVPATVLRPVIFMEDLTEKKYVPPAAWGTMTRVVGAQTPMHWIAVEDIGAVAAKVFAQPQGYIGRTLTLVGDVRSMAECQRLFREIQGRKPFALPMPAWMFRSLVSRDLYLMWRWIAAAGFTAHVSETRAIHPEVMDMATWLRRKSQELGTATGR